MNEVLNVCAVSQIEVKENVQIKVLLWEYLGYHDAKNWLSWTGSYLIYPFDDFFLLFLKAIPS